MGYGPSLGSLIEAYNAPGTAIPAATNVAAMMRANQLAPVERQQVQAQTAGLQAQVPIQQQQAEELRLKNEQQRLQLENMTKTQAILSDPDFGKKLSAASGAEPTEGANPLGLHPIAQYMASQGLPLMGPGGAAEMSDQFTAHEEKLANLHKTKTDAEKAALENHDKQVANWTKDVASVSDDASVPAFVQKVMANQQNYPPDIIPHLQGAATVGDLIKISNGLEIHKAIDEAAQEKAKAVEATAPKPEQILNAQSTVHTYGTDAGGAIPPVMVQAFAKELAAAPTVSDLKKIQDRADAANESFQRSADARKQAEAMKDIGMRNLVAGKLVTEDEKLGAALDQTSGIRGLLDMSKGGNEVATSAAQTRFAEHEIVEGGVKRMNQTEYQNLAGSLGDYGRKWSAWVDKGFKGQMPPATNAEMQKILDAEDKAANTTHERNVGYVQSRYGGESAAPSAAAAPAQPVKQHITHRFNPTTGQIEAVTNAQ